MRSIVRPIAAIGLALALAACNASATQAPTSAPGGATAAPGGTGTAKACQESTGTTTVSASIENFAFSPATVNAKVGDVITWTNKDTASHGVGLDDGSCSMAKSLSNGSSSSLVFSVAGTYPFHCTVHSSMKGTIVIT